MRHGDAETRRDSGGSDLAERTRGPARRGEVNRTNPARAVGVRSGETPLLRAPAPNGAKSGREGGATGNGVQVGKTAGVLRNADARGARATRAGRPRVS
jgi:hypothetical protein